AILLGAVVTNLILIVAILAGGMISDRIGRRPPLITGLLLLALLAFPFFWVADLAEPHWIWLAMFLLSAPMWFVWGVLPAIYSEFFPTQLRYSGISIGSQVATIIGGFVPLFATVVVAEAGTWPVSVLNAGCAVLAIVALISMQRRKAHIPTIDDFPDG